MLSVLIKHQTCWSQQTAGQMPEPQSEIQKHKVLPTQQQVLEVLKKTQVRNCVSSRPIQATHWLYIQEMLHKEIRAVKLVFLQRVREVTTDGADAAQQPTAIQYWFTTFFTAKEAQLNGCSCQMVNSTSISRIKSSYLTGSGLTERQLVSVR